MKKTSVIVTLVVVLSVLSAFAYIPITLTVATSVSTVEVEPLAVQEIVLQPDKIEIPAKDHAAFLNDIGFRESSNNYTIVNKWGYMGKYQFGKETLRAIGISVSKEEFLSNPNLQEQAMYLLLKHNHKNLNKVITKYNNSTVHGVYVTESGILAAAHLAGAGNVRKWFRKGEDFKDGKGTKLTSYLKRFSGYQLEF